uniref:Uncharacterized protein n=1 Tax=Schistosoma japonicum TaxID=6182 RepID=Q5BZR1_SCHJA|nr:unknown [Schistosoma japonicum]
MTAFFNAILKDEKICKFLMFLRL